MNPAEIINRHFDKLRTLIELEEAEELEQFRQDFLQLTAEEREKAGKALLHLRLTESHYNPAGHRLLTFNYADGRPLPVFSFDVGDIVSLSREGIDLPRYPIGTVYEKEPSSVTVAFDWIHEEWIDESGLFQLNRSGNRATYKRMYEALEEVRMSGHDRPSFFRDVSLGLKVPAQGDPVDIAEIPFFNPDLNQWQREAVKTVLEARDIAIVHGPPGTGKTTVLIEVIRQAAEKGAFVHATAPSNTACDNLLEGLVKSGVRAIRLGHPARIMHHLREHTLDFRTAAHPQAEWVDEREREIDLLYLRLDRHRDRRSLHGEAKREIHEKIRELKKEVRDAEKEILHQILIETQVIVGTHASFIDFALRGRHVDLLVMDEASQATEPLAWIPILRARKVVLAGDHFQLPPTVRSKKAEEGGLARTLFERFHEILPDTFKTLLRVQYRMHEKIMNFSSRQFYQGKLIADVSVKDHVLAGLPGVKDVPETREAFVFLDTAGRGFEEKLETGSESRYNPEEAALVLKELDRLLGAGVKAEDIAVICPYSAQVRYLSARIPDKSIEVDSVDGFQGREKEAVILSLVRSNVEGEMGFLVDSRRMNVAMTRARRKLLVIGDSATLSAIPFYQNFIQYSETVNAYRSIWEYSE
jgi:ATP-dependent RNA/DNA helicase IGHMBP2